MYIIQVFNQLQAEICHKLPSTTSHLCVDYEHFGSADPACMSLFQRSITSNRDASAMIPFFQQNKKFIHFLIKFCHLVRVIKINNKKLNVDDDKKKF